jgi:hypothetical protein
MGRDRSLRHLRVWERSRSHFGRSNAVSHRGNDAVANSMDHVARLRYHQSVILSVTEVLRRRPPLCVLSPLTIVRRGGF